MLRQMLTGSLLAGTILVSIMLPTTPSAQTVAPSVPPAPSVTPPTAATTNPAATDPADLAFWNSIKDSKVPDEYKAYLTQYPNGAFASLARIRLKAVEQTAATPTIPIIKPQAAPTAPIAPTAPTNRLTSEPVLKEVQNRLYEMNFSITSVSGTLTTETTEAIRNWQRLSGYPQTGELTEPQLARLRTQTPPRQWGTLAFAPDIRETAVGTGTRRETEGRALAACSQKANGQDCKVMTAAGSSCIAAAGYKDATGKPTSATFAARQATLAQAQTQALASCNQDPRSNSACEIIAKICAGGAQAPTRPTAPTRTPPKKGEQQT
jgi:Domain of unknown function (DUF4189)/Putative peptidoglycan binding domain